MLPHADRKHAAQSQTVGCRPRAQLPRGLSGRGGCRVRTGQGRHQHRLRDGKGPGDPVGDSGSAHQDLRQRRRFAPHRKLPAEPVLPSRNFRADRRAAGPVACRTQSASRRLTVAAAIREEESIMISRHWRGLARAGRAEAYVEHLRTETFPQLSQIPGFIDASIMRRNVQQGVEFLIVTNWESIEAIEQFSGRNVETAVVPETVQEMMIEYDGRVRHYEVVA